MGLRRAGLVRVGLRRVGAAAGGDVSLGPAGLVSWSPADFAWASQNFLLVAGDFTLGTRFEATREGLVCTGARVIVPTGAALPLTMKASLYYTTGATLLATKSNVLSSVGVHSIIFDSPVSLGGDGNDLFTIAMYQDNAAHVRFGDPAALPGVPINAGAIVFQGLNFFVAGDSGAAPPGGESGANRYPVGPIVEEA